MGNFRHCIRCKAEFSVITVTALCGNECYINYPDGRNHRGKVPKGIGLGDESDTSVAIDYCQKCGQMQGLYKGD